MRALLSLESLNSKHASTHSELLIQLQLKLAVNCAINPLTAILGCQNGRLLEDTSTQ